MSVRYRLREDWNTGPQFLVYHSPSSWGTCEDKDRAYLFRSRTAAEKVAAKINPARPYSYHENEFYVEEVVE